MRIKVADTVFDINNKFPYCEQFMTDYLTDEEADFFIDLDIEFLEKKRSLKPDGFHIGYTEYLEIYRVICEYITNRDGMLMHGAVIEYEGAAYMFTAPSGTGKTTHIKQWKKAFRDKVKIINGDKPIIRLVDGEYIVYGTPWCGKEHYNRNTKAPLRGIVLLSRGEENSISKVSSEIFNEFLIKQVYIPKNPQKMIKALDFADKMFQSVPLYSLKCNISPDAARVACNEIHKG